MLTLSLLIGNIGSGKSTLASKLSLKGDVVVNMDALQAMFAAGAYDRYDNAKKEVYHKTENVAIESALEAGLSVVIDRTNIDRKRRENFIRIGQKYGAEIVAYDFGPGEHRLLERRQMNGRGVPSETWRRVFDFMKKSYEAPTLEEGFSQIIEAPKKYKFYAFDFDGTIVENRCPDIGDIIDGTVQKMNELFEDLSNIVIIWTNRDGDLQAQMRQFLVKHKIPFDFINENPMWEGGSRKIFAHEYYDDRNAWIGSKK